MTTINEAGIPDELKTHRQWVAWRYEQIDPPPKKPTKVPYSAITGRRASAVDRFTWSTFDDALRFQVANQYSGIGFVLTREDPYCVIDLDEPSDAEQLQRNNDIFFDMASYTEFSPSGKGVHIWTKAEVAKGRNRRPIEVYSSVRFITVTGNVCNPVEIEYRQEKIKSLWDEIAPKTAEVFVSYDGSDPEPCSDQDVINKAASAKNGYKFSRLWHGEYSEWYASQSEADIALINIIAFFTQNTEQVARLFRFSELGKRDKAWRDSYILPTINKAYDQLPPKVDFAAMQQMTQQWLAQHTAEEEMKKQQHVAAVTPDQPDLLQQEQPSYTHKVAESVKKRFDVEAYVDSDVDAPYTFPDGLVGEIAEYIYRSSPRPVKEIALGAAVGLMAGITGNSFNVSGLGLNMYILILAETGTGKESVHTGISKLMQTIKPIVPSSELFIGASDIASPQALMRRLAEKQRCFVSVIGECGMWLKELSEPKAPAHIAGLRRALLALYGRSGMGQVVQPAIYADSAKNTDAIVSPAVSLLGESTASRFFDMIDEDLISEGFIPRWTMIEYKGERPPHNKEHGIVYPSNELITGLAALTNYCVQQMHSLQATHITYTSGAEVLIDEFDKYCDAQINSTAEDSIRNLWTRAHVKALKLAGLVAVGRSIQMPVIDEKAFLWARNFILKDVTRMCRRFNAGLLSSRTAQGDSEQQAKIVEAIRLYIKDTSVDAKYGIKPSMRLVNAIPYYYLQRKLMNTKLFRADKRGAANALQNAIRTMMLAGFLTEVPQAQAQVQFGFNGKVYAAPDLELLLQQGT